MYKGQMVPEEMNLGQRGWLSEYERDSGATGTCRVPGPPIMARRRDLASSLRVTNGFYAGK